MSLDPPAYIYSLKNNIRARPISWEGAVRAKTITEADLKNIKSVDKVRKEQRKQTIESNLSTYVVLILGGEDAQGIFEAAAKRADIVQYMLVLTVDLIDDVPAFLEALIQHPHPFDPFLPLLKTTNNPEDPIPLLTSTTLSRLASEAVLGPKEQLHEVDKALPQLYNYLSNLARSSDAGLQDIAVQEYSSLLRNTHARKLFWSQRKQTVDPLMSILRSAAGAGRDNDSTIWSGASTARSASDGIFAGGVSIQLLYHVLMNIWQLSFEAEMVGVGLQEEHKIIALYSQLLRISPKEKITRLLLSTLFNLLSRNRSTLLPIAMLARLPSVLQHLRGRHLTDTDLLEDLDSLSELLDEYTRKRTTFDEYAAEVSSGHLHWSPPHRNATFWRDNARKIVEHENGELLKKLVGILSKSWDGDKQVLAVGCNDVTCLVKEVPEKRSVMEKVGLKSRVMQLMQDGDESVRWESLRAVGEWLRYNVE